jgi:hypothetical protein
MVGRTAPGGWSVGRYDDRGLLLRLEYVGGVPSWLTVSEEQTGPLPPLSDLHVFDSSQVLNDAWMVSAEAGEVLRARLGTNVAGTRSVVEVTGSVVLRDHRGGAATPLEIAMASRDSGWIAGETGRGEVVAWRFLDALDWAVELVASDQKLVDLYLDESRTWWLGLTPMNGADSVLRYNDRADGQGLWQSADRRPPPSDGDTGAGGRAVAPIDDQRVLYARGDDVWLHESGELAWQRARLRRHSVGVAPNQDGTGGWAIADTVAAQSAASEFLTVSGLGVRSAAGSAAPGVELLPRLGAVDSGGGAWWAVGDAGSSFYRRGSAGAWQPATGAGNDIRFTDVAVAADGTAWASADRSEGGGALYRYDEVNGAWVIAAEARQPLVAVAALVDGRAWAVGHGTVCECLGAGAACMCNQALMLGDRPLPLVAVAASDGPAGAEVWAAGEYIMLRRGAGGWRPRDVRGVTGIPSGAAITDMAAGAADDLWVVASCNPYGHEGRGVSMVNHITDTVASEGERIHSRMSTALSVPIRDVRVRATAGGRAVWIAGDWSTVATLAYSPDDLPALSGEEAATDLWCLQSGRGGEQLP